MFRWSEASAEPHRWKSESHRAFSSGLGNVAPPPPPRADAEPVTAGFPPSRGEPLALFGSAVLAAANSGVVAKEDAAASAVAAAADETTPLSAEEDAETITESWVLVDPAEEPLAKAAVADSTGSASVYATVAAALAALDRRSNGTVQFSELKRVCTEHGVWPKRLAVKPLVIAFRGAQRRMHWEPFVAALEHGLPAAAPPAPVAEGLLASQVAPPKTGRFLANGAAVRESGRAPFCLYNSRTSYNRNAALERASAAAKAVLASHSAADADGNVSGTTGADVDVASLAIVNASTTADAAPDAAPAATGNAVQAAVTLTASLEARYSSVREAFLATDVDRSGYIDKSELLRLCVIFNHDDAGEFFFNRFIRAPPELLLTRI